MDLNKLDQWIPALALELLLKLLQLKRALEGEIARVYGLNGIQAGVIYYFGKPKESWFAVVSSCRELYNFERAGIARMDG